MAASSADSSCGENASVFRRTSGSARITIFDGGHEIVYKAALTWIKKKKNDLISILNDRRFVPV